MEIETWQLPHLALLAADMVLFARDDRGLLHVLLIERRDDPFAGCWALPGGLVDVEQKETFEQAACRELFEETGITAPERVTEVGCYGEPDRDSRRRVVTVAYAAELPALVVPVAGDDAVNAKWVPWLAVSVRADALAFDHHQILAAAHAALPHDPWA